MNFHSHVNLMDGPTASLMDEYVIKNSIQTMDDRLIMVMLLV